MDSVNDRETLKAFIKALDRRIGDKEQEIKFKQLSTAKSMLELANTKTVKEQAEQMYRDMEPRLRLVKKDE